MSQYQSGQVWRDTYYDDEPNHPGSTRHILLLGREPDGRWLCVTFDAESGRIIGSPSWRKSRLKDSTLAQQYVRVEHLDSVAADGYAAKGGSK